MADLNDIMQNPTKEDEVTIDRGFADPTAAIRAATGLNITKETMEQVQRSGAANKDNGMRMLSPDEAKQLTDDTEFHRVDVEAEITNAENKRIDNLANKNNENMLNMFRSAAEEEEKRDTRMGEILEDEDARKELYKGTDPVDTGTATYTEQLGTDEDNNIHSMPKPEIHARTNVVDDEDLIPAYSGEEYEEETPEVDEKEKSDRPTAGDSDEEYAEYIKNLVTIPYEDPNNERAVTVVREKVPMSVQEVDSKRNNKRGQILGDQAFQNSINKFKKDNFRTVSIPLVNSGFNISIVGTGAVDLTMLYTAVDENTMAVDYELEKMRTVIRNVVGTEPKISPEKLRNMIHFADYQLMAYAHIAATLKDVELIHTCEECGKDFHIICKSSDLILNMNEMNDKIQQISGAASINENSLLATDRMITTPNGFLVDIGHPSYSEYVKYLSELKDLAQRLPQTESIRVTNMADMLPFVRKITLPNGVSTNSLYQRYMATTLLSDADYAELTKEVEDLRKQIIMPRFGIKKVECPHCHKMNTEIVYRDLNDLLFFHITVTRLLNQTAQ